MSKLATSLVTQTKGKILEAYKEADIATKMVLEKLFPSVLPDCQPIKFIVFQIRRDELLLAAPEPLTTLGVYNSGWRLGNANQDAQDAISRAGMNPEDLYGWYCYWVKSAQLEISEY